MSAEAGQVDRSPSPRADVCVVGSGVAGALVAHSLAERGHDVVILEAGERFDRADRLERMEIGIRPSHTRSEVWNVGGPRDRFTSSGEFFYELNEKRIKGVGGTTLHWGGHTPRMHPKDFEMQSRYGLAMDWPISYDDLRPYYVRAEREMGVSGSDDNPFVERDEPYPMPPFPPSYSDSLFAEACEELGIATHSLPKAINSEPRDGRSECLGFSTCIPVCPSGAKYSGDVHVRKAEEEGARVIDRAPAQRLVHGEDPRTVEAVAYATPDGTTHLQTARQFVVACGGVETPRLLLLSKSNEHRIHRDGFANASGAVGRYFMDHPHGHAGGRLDRSLQQDPIGYVTSQSQQFYEHEEPTPGSIVLTFGNDPAVSGIDAAMGGGDRSLRGDLWDAFTGDQWGDELLAEMRTRANGGARLRIFASVEMLPAKENRVTLDYSTRDNHGNPVPDVSIGIGSHGRKTMRRAAEIQHDIFGAMGATDRWTYGPDESHFASHQMGTTRMGVRPETSVVDARLRTHDVRNLSIASSSVFPTGGAVNPTLTIAALSLKAADHVHEDL